MKLVGLLPAGGRAARINGLPKYLLPVPGGNLMQRHVEQMTEAGAGVVLISAGWHNMGVVSAFAPAGTEVYALDSRTVGEALLAARSLVRDRAVLFGMPDTYWDTDGVYELLAKALDETDVAVACWRMREDQRGQLGQCGIRQDENTIYRIIDKSITCIYEWVWGAIAWKPSFWRFIQPEYAHMGQAIEAALEESVRVSALCFDGDYHDCGTFENYARLCSQFMEAV